MTDDFKKIAIREAVGIFDSADALQAALDDLSMNGFSRLELSVLADEKTVAEKLGHKYRKVRQAEDDPDAPRTIWIPTESIGEAQGASISLPMYIAGATASATFATGGTFLTAILATVAASAVGAAIGGVFARLIAQRHANYIQEQVELGGLLLWVHLRTPQRDRIAKDILKKHGARDIHVHEFPLHG